MLQECHVLDYVIIQKNIFYNIPSEQVQSYYNSSQEWFRKQCMYTNQHMTVTMKTNPKNNRSAS